MPGRRVAVISLVAAGAGLWRLFNVWWLPGGSGQSQRTIGDQRVSDLISQGNIDDLDAADRRELLERLLASVGDRSLSNFWKPQLARHALVGSDCCSSIFSSATAMFRPRHGLNQLQRFIQPTRTSSACRLC